MPGRSGRLPAVDAATGRSGWPGRGTALVRALYLAGVGLVLAQAGAQVLIVLGHLAALTVVLVALAPLRSGALLLVAGVTYAVAPFLQDRLHAGGEVALFVAGGYPYRPWAMNIETRAAPRGCAPGRGPEPPPTSWSWGCWAWC